MVYGDQFFDWVTYTASRSARVVVPLLMEQTGAQSVLDVGCGQGAWLRVWREQGLSDYLGVDGSYVNQNRLCIPKDRFLPADLAESWTLDRRFDLVQSLEVAEHLPEASARRFVSCLCNHADLVFFSAAQPGQGGEFHVNEQPPGYWVSLFAEHGFAVYDSIRPLVSKNKHVDTWYRFNALLYANSSGMRRLSEWARACRVENVAHMKSFGSFGWNLQRALIRPLPVAAVTQLSRLRSRLAMASRNRKWNDQ